MPSITSSAHSLSQAILSSPKSPSTSAISSSGATAPQSSTPSTLTPSIVPTCHPSSKSASTSVRDHDRTSAALPFFISFFFLLTLLLGGKECLIYIFILKYSTLLLNIRCELVRGHSSNIPLSIPCSQVNELQCRQFAPLPRHHPDDHQNLFGTSHTGRCLGDLWRW